MQVFAYRYLWRYAEWITQLSSIPIVRTGAAFICTITCFGALAPLWLYTISPGIDLSWMAALAEANRTGLVFGRDLIHTGGPLSSVYTHYFDAQTAWWLVSTNTAVAIIVGYFAAAVLCRAGLPTAVPLIAAIAFSTIDALFMFVPLVAVAGGKPSSRWDRLALVMAAATAAALTLAKFSVLPVAIVCFLAADIGALRERFAPFATASYVIALVGIYALLEGDIRAFIPYLRYSFETSIGYNEAMSLRWIVEELQVYLGLLCLFGTVVGVVECRALRECRDAEALAFLLPLATFVFLTFKAGFVRHDLHSLTAWSGLMLAASIYLARRWHRLCSASGLKIAIIILLASFPVIAVTMQSHASSIVFKSSPFDYAAGKVRMAVANWHFGKQLLSSPSSWLRSADDWRASRTAVMREEHPLPKLDGPVDIIPSRQSEVIANDLDYRPRFTVQEYTTYTGALIQANRDYFNGAYAPRYILFRPGSIDGRHPALAEGPLWPDFMRLYQSGGLLGDLLLLCKRDVPSASVLSDPKVLTAKNNKDFPLPGGVIFIKADLRKTILGHILNVAYKLPHVWAQIEYSDGSISRYKIIPGIAREGFLISPLVSTAQQFASLMDGESPEPGRQAVSVRFMLHATFYAEDITVETFSLNIK
jgi:hypothetical protein